MKMLDHLLVFHNEIVLNVSQLFTFFSNFDWNNKTVKNSKIKNINPGLTFQWIQKDTYLLKSLP